MKVKIHKLILAGLLLVILASALEVVFYFIKGTFIGVPSGIPKTGDIFSPIVLNQYYMTADEHKTFYNQRLNDFASTFNLEIASKSSFVKTAEADYVIGGTVVGVKPITSTVPGDGFGYDITLKNSSSDSYIEHIDPTEVRYVQVFLRSLSSSTISKAVASLSQVKAGDYLVIKRSTNLLNPDELNIDIEILRYLK